MSLVDGLLLDPFPHDAQSPASLHAGNLGPTFGKLAPLRSNSDPAKYTNYPQLYDEFDDALSLGL